VREVSATLGLCGAIPVEASSPVLACSSLVTEGSLEPPGDFSANSNVWGVRLPAPPPLSVGGLFAPGFGSLLLIQGRQSSWRVRHPWQLPSPSVVTREHLAFLLRHDVHASLTLREVGLNHSHCSSASSFCGLLDPIGRSSLTTFSRFRGSKHGCDFDIHLVQPCLLQVVVREHPIFEARQEEHACARLPARRS
jgi:hypothetical protein